MYAAAVLTGEAIDDEAIVRVYDGTTLSVEVSGGAALPLPAAVPFPVEVSLSVGYRRPGGKTVALDGVTPTEEGSWIWYAPIALTAGPTFPLGPVDLHLSGGPVWVPWAEMPRDDGLGGSSGVKVGGLVQGEARLHLREINQGLHGPDLRRPDVLVVFGAGARVHHLFCPDDTCGLDFGAVRVSAGVGLEIP